jgi:hypothetical protein
MKKLWKDVKPGDRVVVTVEIVGGRDTEINGCPAWQFEGIQAYDFENVYPTDMDSEVEVHDDSIIKEAVEFVRMAGKAGETAYGNPCRCCHEYIHAPDCRLAAWLKRMEGK